MKLLIILRIVLCVFGLGINAHIVRRQQIIQEQESPQDIEYNIASMMRVTVPLVCNRTGSGNSQVFSNGVEKFTKCMDEIYHFDSLQNKTIGNTKEDLKNALEEYCPTLSAAFVCIDELSTVSNMCLLAEEIKNKDSIVRIFKNLLNYGCADNGTNLLKLRTEENEVCFKDTATAINDCWEPIMSKHTSSEGREDYTMTPEDCHDFSVLKNCAITNLQTCNDDAPAIFANDVFDIMLGELQCGNFVS